MNTTFFIILVVAAWCLVVVAAFYLKKAEDIHNIDTVMEMVQKARVLLGFCIIILATILLSLTYDKIPDKRAVLADNNISESTVNRRRNVVPADSGIDTNKRRPFTMLLKNR